MATIAQRAKLKRVEFNMMMRRLDSVVQYQCYPSAHFFERVVERGFDKKIQSIFIALCKTYNYFKSTTYNLRKLKVLIDGMAICFDIKINPLSKDRVLIMSTVYDIEHPNIYFDEQIRI